MEKKKIDIIDKACEETLAKYNPEQVAYALYLFMIFGDTVAFTSDKNRENLKNISSKEMKAFVVEHILINEAYRRTVGEPTRNIPTNDFGQSKTSSNEETVATASEFSKNLWELFEKGEYTKMDSYVGEEKLSAHPEKTYLFNAALSCVLGRYIDGKKSDKDLFAQTPAGKEITSTIENLYNTNDDRIALNNPNSTK